MSQTIEFDRDRIVACLDAPELARQRSGAFLAFAMIPVVQRIGQWRFAGAATDLDAALRRCEALINHWHLDPRERANWPQYPAGLRRMIDGNYLEYPRDLSASWSDPAAGRPLESVRYVILTEGGAPMDYIGFAVLELATLDGHPYADRPPESKPPLSWSSGEDEDHVDEDLDADPDTWLEPLPD